jgi:hypothetical protein
MSSHWWYQIGSPVQQDFQSLRRSCPSRYRSRSTLELSRYKQIKLVLTVGAHGTRCAGSASCPDLGSNSRTGLHADRHTGPTERRTDGDPLATAFGSVPADAGIGADPQYPIRGVTGQVDDLVSLQARRSRARDRTSEPVPRFDELVLGPLAVLEGNCQAVHASQSDTRRCCRGRSLDHLRRSTWASRASRR